MKKLGSFIKNNVIGFILGAIIFGGSALVVAGTVASSEITYTENGQTTVQGALNDLYERADIYNEWKKNYSGYVYWTDNYSGTSYSSTSVPNILYLNYYSFLKNPPNYTAFIRTTLESGGVTKHEVCTYLKLTNKAFCIDDNYWKLITGSNESSNSNGQMVMNALKAAMEESLGATMQCTYYSGYVWCGYNTSSLCYVFASGYQKCQNPSGSGDAFVKEDRSALAVK